MARSRPMWFDQRMSVRVAGVVPTLRMFDVATTKRFYVDYLGCSLDWEDGSGDEPIDMQVSRGELLLQLSSHHDDGTPGSVVLVMVRGVAELHAELRNKRYPFFNPAVGPGPGGGLEMQVIDPASNRLRFYERAATG
jgi:catechol 2,3-dioxygenase-like lactoylglutathione lyase family enzyme